MSLTFSVPRLSQLQPMSVADVYAIGIGPSSSHTVGPMRAAAAFVQSIAGSLTSCTGVKVELFGSLALTGKGHATDIAIMLGLAGYDPATVDPEQISAIITDIRSRKEIDLGGVETVPFAESDDLIFRKGDDLPFHPNAMRFSAFAGSNPLSRATIYSIGGGAIVVEGARSAEAVPVRLPRYPFSSAAELLDIGRTVGLSVAGIVQANERAWRCDDETAAFLDRVHATMMDSIARGCVSEGILPGGLNVRRRAPSLFKTLQSESRANDAFHAMDLVSLYALAVNEENAAGNRIVTAPTNGAAGIIPAVLKYVETFCPDDSLERSRDFLLTAAAIGMLYKMRASVSAAEMGCQGEVGVACSMAAGALAAVFGGTNEQVANAAEIAMEHNLGLTCDPIGGLVQIPCIERNTMGAIKAINASRLALRGDGNQVVSLDAVIETMRQTGVDMSIKYKETSTGGLAVNVVAC